MVILKNLGLSIEMVWVRSLILQQLPSIPSPIDLSPKVSIGEAFGDRLFGDRFVKGGIQKIGLGYFIMGNLRTRCLVSSTITTEPFLSILLDSSNTCSSRFKT